MVIEWVNHDPGCILARLSVPWSTPALLATWWGDGRSDSLRNRPVSHVDQQARPQDDLFGHVNGRWLAEYEIPADRATDGAFRSLYDRAEEQIRD